MCKTSQTQLAPCPFCLNDTVEIVEDIRDREYHGYCINCYAQGPPHGDENAAIELWNARGFIEFERYDADDTRA